MDGCGLDGGEVDVAILMGGKDGEDDRFVVDKLKFP